KEFATLYRPFANLRILFADTLNRGVPIHVTGDQLAARINRGRDHRYTGHFALNRVEVFNRQSVRAAVPSSAANTAHVLRPGAYEQQIRPDAVNLCLNGSLSALADTYHRHHGGNADNDSQHRQRRTHLVALQSTKGDANDHQKVHDFLLVFFVVRFNRRQIAQFFPRVTLIFNRIILLNLSIFKDDNTLRVLRDVRFVRNQHQSDATFAIQTLEDFHHFNRGARI